MEDNKGRLLIWPVEVRLVFAGAMSIHNNGGQTIEHVKMYVYIATHYCSTDHAQVTKCVGLQRLVGG